MFLLVLAHLGSPGQSGVDGCFVYLCVCVLLLLKPYTNRLTHIPYHLTALFPGLPGEPVPER